MGTLISQSCINEANISENDKKSINCLYSTLKFKDISKILLAYDDIETMVNNKMIEYFLRNKMDKELKSMFLFSENMIKISHKYANNQTMRENSYIMLRNELFNKISKNTWNKIYNEYYNKRLYIINKMNIIQRSSHETQKKFEYIISYVSKEYKEMYSSIMKNKQHV